MTGVFTQDCEAAEDSEDVRVLEDAAAQSTSLVREHGQLSLNSPEDDYAAAALAVAEARIHGQVQLASHDNDDVTLDHSGICFGGYCLEDEKCPQQNQQDSLSLHDLSETSNSAGFLLLEQQDAQRCATTDQASANPLQGMHQQLDAPPDDHEVAEVLDEACYETNNHEPAPSRAKVASTASRLSAPLGANVCSSLWSGALGITARRRSTETVTWCSQHQAATLFCLQEQLLREEAAAGRLRVRQQPNPHGESFKPMRLYAVKEVEELAIRVWGSLEAARAAKERRIEERWQRKKRCSIQPPTTKKKEVGNASPPRTLGHAAVEQPIHRAREDKWEEI